MKNSILKKTATFFIFLITISLYAQNSEVKVVDLKPAFDDNKFPEVQIKNDLKTQKKINTFLQLEHLEHLPNVFQKNPYENLKIDEDSDMYRTSFYGWKVNESPKNILSIVIEAEYTGAYSEESTIHNNFDLRNGNKITTNNIFTKEGKTAFTKLLNQKVSLEIKNFIKDLKQTKPADKQEKETIALQIEVYGFCLENLESATLEYYDFTFQKNNITFFKGRCSNHAMRALDELDTFEISFTYKEIEKYLTPYGKSLCFENLKEEKTNSFEGKIFRGKINEKYPITAVIQEVSPNSPIHIIYWYDKYNLPIEWTGKFEKNQFHLYEVNEANQEIVVEATYSENKIVGFWKNKTTNKTLKLELNEY